MASGAVSAAHEPAESAAPHYLTPAQVAELLQVCEKTVLRWSLEDASMPVLRRGGVVRFHRERLERWLERQEPRSVRRLTYRSRTTAEPAASAGRRAAIYNHAHLIASQRFQQGPVLEGSCPRAPSQRRPGGTAKKIAAGRRRWEAVHRQEPLFDPGL